MPHIPVAVKGAIPPKADSSVMVIVDVKPATEATYLIAKMVVLLTSISDTMFSYWLGGRGRGGTYFHTLQCTCTDTSQEST